jgi:hypothetical protein
MLGSDGGDYDDDRLQGCSAVWCDKIIVTFQTRLLPSSAASIYRNVCDLLPDQTALQPRRRSSSSEFVISQYDTRIHST